MKTPSERISVHHVKDRQHIIADLHLYCGRSLTPSFMIRAELGNPFPMATSDDRDLVCDAFEKDMKDPKHPYWPRIKRISERLAEGRKIALYCHCAPKRCHCDTIRELALAGLNK